MTDVTTESPVRLEREAVIPLLKEYTEKLKRISEQAQQLIKNKPRGLFAGGMPPESRAEHESLKDLLQMLSPPAKQLAEHVSQQIEFGSLDLLENIELKMRLVEFENALLSAQKMLKVSDPG
jgi:hypothetical protein